MNILLTGATGFLGSHVLAMLIEYGHEVTVLKRKVSNLSRIQPLTGRFHPVSIEETPLEDLFARYRIDIIIHCATDYGRKQSDPADILESNLIFPLRLLHHGAGSGVKCFINTDTILDKRVSHYSLSKNQFREWLGLYAGKLVCINVALEHFYGPADDPTKFVSFLVNSLSSHVDHVDLTLGEQKRSFIYIDDVVDAFMKIITAAGREHAGYFHYEIASDISISIRDFAELVKTIAQAETTELRFGAVPYRENEVMEIHVDTTSVKRLGWVPGVSLEEGLARTIEAAKGQMNR